LNNVEVWSLELGSFASVTAFVDRFDKDGGTLDVLVLNAAVALSEFTQTQDGWETQVQVNHLSTALLSWGLLPQLAKTTAKSGGHARIVVVSSNSRGDFGTKRISSMQVLATLNDPTFPTPVSYPNTKVMNILFVSALAAHLPPTSAIIIATVDPGFCLSDLRRNIGGHAPLQDLLPYARTTEEGSRQLIYAALAAEAEGQLDSFRGGYVEHAEITSASPWTLGAPPRRCKGLGNILERDFRSN